MAGQPSQERPEDEDDQRLEVLRCAAFAALLLLTYSLDYYMSSSGATGQSIPLRHRLLCLLHQCSRFR